MGRKGRTGKKDDDLDDDDESNLDKGLLNAIRRIVREEVSKRLDKIETDIADLKQVNTHVDDLQKALDHTSARLDFLIKTTLPALTDHMAKVAEAVSMRHLELNVHRRKWNLILHGIPGNGNEEETQTRTKSKTFAKDVLKVADAESTMMSACHRLSNKPNAGIIIRFVDMAQRDQWLSGTVNLRGYQHKVSLSPDLPPELRSMKDSLMKTRSELEPDIKSRSRVRYVPKWPFVQLKLPTQSLPIVPEKSQTSLIKDVLGINPFFKIVESTED